MEGLDKQKAGPARKQPPAYYNAISYMSVLALRNEPVARKSTDRSRGLLRNATAGLLPVSKTPS